MSWPISVEIKWLASEPVSTLAESWELALEPICSDECITYNYIFFHLYNVSEL